MVSVLENEKHKILWDFKIQTDHLIPTRRLDLVEINKKKSGQSMDFAVSVDHRGKMRESKKIDKYLHLARELKMLWNTMVIVILIVVSMLGTIPKSLKIIIRGKIETIQTTSLLISARILRRVLEN